MNDDWQCVSHGTPIGVIDIWTCDQHLKALSLNNGNPFDQHPTELHREVVSQLDAYFEGRLQRFDLPIAAEGTDFEKKIWELLVKTPYGSTISYAELSRLYGNIKAIRAVGKANGKNPIPIIIPCHRVIGSDGSLTGFALGLEVKRRLLNLECPGRFIEQGRLF